MAKIRFLLLLIVAAASGMHAARAQLPRSARSIVRGGMFQKPDSLRARRDSIRFAELALKIDSALQVDYLIDSTAVTAVRTGASKSPHPRGARPNTAVQREARRPSVSGSPSFSGTEHTCP